MSILKLSSFLFSPPLLSEHLVPVLSTRWAPLATTTPPLILCLTDEPQPRRPPCLHRESRAPSSVLPRARSKPSHLRPPPTYQGEADQPRSSPEPSAVPTPLPLFRLSEVSNRRTAPDAPERSFSSTTSGETILSVILVTMIYVCWILYSAVLQSQEKETMKNEITIEREKRLQAKRRCLLLLNWRC